MNHYSACHGLKLEPTTLSDIIPWNYNIMKDIVEGLQLSIVNNSHGLRGCCVPSLWCSNTECYTQSLQSNYVNYHSTHPIDLNTVYTCRVGSLSKSITVEKGSLQNGVIVISGNNFGNKENNIDSVIGTSPITNIESCNTVCQSCESSPCAKDNACVLVDSTYSCLMFCNGPGDTSCPCGTVCQHVNVYTSQSSYVTTHFCAPKGLECDNYLASTINQFQGLSPRIYNWVNDTDIPSSKSNIFDVTVSVPEYNTGDLPVEIDMQSCTTHSQCFDGSPFTEETCQDGKCFFKQLSQIGSTLPMIRERSRSFSYVMFATENMETDQAMFESRVRLDGVLLNSVSDADDLPQEYFSLGFSFLYFGNKVSNIAINPNGLVSFPPYPYCHALAGTLYVSRIRICFVYKSLTVVIVPCIWNRNKYNCDLGFRLGFACGWRFIHGAYIKPNSR